MAMNFPRMRSTPPPGARLVKDWEGMRVRTVCALTNGWGKMPKGSIVTVASAGSGAGLRLQGDPCPCCGVVITIARVRSTDVEPVDMPSLGMEADSDKLQTRRSQQ